MDKDGNGKLDVAEFRDALAKLGMQHLTGSTVSTIFSAMDIHGPITLEDFLHIVEVLQNLQTLPMQYSARQHASIISILKPPLGQSLPPKQGFGIS